MMGRRSRGEMDYINIYTLCHNSLLRTSCSSDIGTLQITPHTNRAKVHVHFPCALYVTRLSVKVSNTYLAMSKAY